MPPRRASSPAPALALALASIVLSLAATSLLLRRQMTTHDAAHRASPPPTWLGLSPCRAKR